MQNNTTIPEQQDNTQTQPIASQQPKTTEGVIHEKQSKNAMVGDTEQKISPETTQTGLQQQQTQQSSINNNYPEQNTLAPMSDTAFANLYGNYMDRGVSPEQLDNVLLNKGFGEERLKSVKEMYRKTVAETNYVEGTQDEKEYSDKETETNSDLLNQFKNDDIGGYEQAEIVTDIVSKIDRTLDGADDVWLGTHVSSWFGDEESQQLLEESSEFRKNEIQKIAKENYGIELQKNRFNEWVYTDTDGLAKNVEPSFFDNVLASTGEIVGDISGAVTGGKLAPVLSKYQRRIGKILATNGMHPAVRLVGLGLYSTSYLYGKKIGAVAGGIAGAGLGGGADYLRYAIETEQEIEMEKLEAIATKGAKNTALFTLAMGGVLSVGGAMLPKGSFEGAKKIIDKKRADIYSDKERQAYDYAKTLGSVRLDDTGKIIPSQEMKNYAKRHASDEFENLSMGDQASIVAILDEQAKKQVQGALGKNPANERILKEQISMEHQKAMNLVSKLAGAGKDKRLTVDQFKKLSSEANGTIIKLYGQTYRNVRKAVDDFDGTVDFDPKKIIKELKSTAENSKDLYDKTALERIIKKYENKPMVLQQASKILKENGTPAIPEVTAPRFEKVADIFALNREVNSFLNNTAPYKTAHFKPLKEMIKEDMEAMARKVGGQSLVTEIKQMHKIYGEVAELRKDLIYDQVFQKTTKMTNLKINKGVSSDKVINIIEDAYYSHEDSVGLIKHLNKTDPKFAQQVEVGLIYRKLNKNYKIEDGDAVMYNFPQMAKDMRTNGKPQFFSRRGKQTMDIIDRLADQMRKDPHLFMMQATPQSAGKVVAALTANLLNKLKFTMAGKLFDTLASFSPHLNNAARVRALEEVTFKFLDNPLNFKNAKAMRNLNKKHGMLTQEQIDQYTHEAKKRAERYLSVAKKVGGYVKNGIDYSQLHRTVPLAYFRDSKSNKEYTIKDLKNDDEALNYLHSNGYKYAIDKNGNMFIVPKER